MISAFDDFEVRTFSNLRLKSGQTSDRRVGIVIAGNE
jgi:hypothetical protein